MTKKLNTSVAVEPTGVIVDVLKRDAESLGIYLDDISIYELGRECDRLSRESQAPFPSKEKFKTYNVYKHGKVLATNASKDQVDRIKDETPAVLVEPVYDEEGYRKMLDAYQTYQSVVRQVFVWGLYYLTDTMDNYKAGKAWSLAYDRGHSSGFGEVASEFDSLLELIK